MVLALLLLEATPQRHFRIGKPRHGQHLRPKVASKDKIPIEIKDFETNRNAKFVK
jgi:hypothetical protein